MKRFFSLLLIFTMLVFSLAACEDKKNNVNGNAAVTPNGSADNNNQKAYSTRIKILINPDADILVDAENNVVDIVCNNDDAKVAYGELDYEGKSVEEVSSEMVKAATENGFMNEDKDVTLTIVDSTETGQDLLNDALEVKAGVQDGLTAGNFENAPIYAELNKPANNQEESDMCDLCFGTGVLVCDECHGTTFCDGNEWTVCGMCLGHKKTLCTLCEGAGTFVCEDCNGTGVDENREDKTCWCCHGEGIVSCPRCQDRSGYVECYDCKGEGRLGGLPCPHCGGTLWCMCHRCNGTGKKNQ